MEKTDRATKKLSVAAWHELGLCGESIPLCTTVSGVSMYPLIRRDRDVVIIGHVNRPLVRGDIVLFHDPARDRYVLHRLWRLAPDRVLTWGDNCAYPDGWMRPEMVWGIAAAMKRGRRTVRFDTNAARKCGLTFAKARHLHCRVRSKAYKFASHLPSPIKAVLKKARNFMRRTKECQCVSTH